MIELRVLGGLGIRAWGGQDLESLLSQPKRAALLVYLALAVPHGFHRRDTLLGLFWPELDDEHARRALRQSLYFLRRELGARAVVSRGEDIKVAETEVWCDAVALEDALARGDAYGAVSLASGELLPGFAIIGADGFNRWLEDERARLLRSCAEAGWRAAEAAEADGDAERAVFYARMAAGFAAGDELGMRRLLALMARVGNRVAAVAAYEAFVARLAQEYELAPSPETTELVEEIRARSASAGVRDHGSVAIAPIEPTELAAQTTSSSSRVRVFATSGALAVLLLVAFLQAHGARLFGNRRSAADKSFAIAPFRTTGTDSTFWTTALPELLSLTLDGMAGLQRTEVVADNAHAGIRLRLRNRFAPRARFFISGSVTASSTAVDVVAYVDDRARGERLGMARLESPRDEPFTVINELAEQIVRQTGLVEAAVAIPRANLAALTTHSRDALAAWLAGERHFRRAEFVEAYADFTRAVELDSTFAVAHLRRWLASAWAGGIPYTSPWPGEAARHLERLPRRDRQLVRAYTEPLRPSIHEALEKLVDTYPDDAELVFELGDRYYHERVQFQLSRDRFQGAFTRALQLDPDFVPARLHLIEDAFAVQDKRRVRNLLKQLEHIKPQPPCLAAYRTAAVLAWGSNRERAKVIGGLDKMTTQALETASRALAYRSYVPALLPVARALGDETRSPEARRTATRLLMAAQFATGRVDLALAAYQAGPDQRDAAVELLRQHAIWSNAGVAVAPAETGDAAELLQTRPLPSERYLLASLASERREWYELETHLEWFDRIAQLANKNGNNTYFAAVASAAAATRARIARDRSDLRGAARIARELQSIPGYWAVSDWAIETWVIDAARIYLDAEQPKAALAFLKPLENTLVDGPPVLLLRAEAEERAGHSREARRQYLSLLALSASGQETIALQHRAQAGLKRLSALE